LQIAMRPGHQRHQGCADKGQQHQQNQIQTLPPWVSSEQGFGAEKVG
jgi:hypothetical protein